MVQQAYELGYEAIAITDECTYSGLVKAHKTAKACGIKLICGAEFVLTDVIDSEASSACRLILLASNRQAYGQIASLISKLRKRSEKGTYQLSLDDLQVGLSDCLGIWVCEGQSVEQLVALGAQLKNLIARLGSGSGSFMMARSEQNCQCPYPLDHVGTTDCSRQRCPHSLPGASGAAKHCYRHWLKTDIQNLGYQGFCNAERTLRPITLCNNCIRRKCWHKPSLSQICVSSAWMNCVTNTRKTWFRHI